MKLHLKFYFCHRGTKTRRDDMYFNLGALELSGCTNNINVSFFDQSGCPFASGPARVKLHFKS